MFGLKEKEPKLSMEMQKIINRSIDEKNGANTDEIFRYKYKIMQLLTSNQDILRALHNADIDNGDEELNGDLYRYVNIFDFMRLPDFQHEVKNYICFEVNDSTYGDYATRSIVFRAVSHEDDCKTDWGIARHDLLASIIKNEFDWSNVFGFHVKKVSDNGHVVDSGYYYREIVYETTVTNNLYAKLNNKSGR